MVKSLFFVSRLSGFSRNIYIEDKIIYTILSPPPRAGVTVLIIIFNYIISGPLGGRYYII